MDSSTPAARAQGSGSRPSSRVPWLRSIRSVPPIVLVLGVYAGSRLLSSLWITLGLLLAPVPPGVRRPGPTPTSFADLSSVWDGWYYRVIATHGYPTALPLDDTGSVQGNPWAFMPVYAWVVHAVDVSTGLKYGTAAIIVAVLAGGAATCVLLRILEPKIGSTRAVWATTLFCCSPMSFVLQVGYAESLFLFLLFAGLLAMQRRRYWASGCSGSGTASSGST